MVMRRKEAKTYGTKKIIEGQFKLNSKCIIIEDLVTSGTSVLETLKVLNNVGLIVTDVAVLIDREQGGKENLLSNNLTLHSCFTINQMLDVLKKHSKIDDKIINNVQTFLKENSQVKVKMDDGNNNSNNKDKTSDEKKQSDNNNTNSDNKIKRISYGERSKLCTNKIAKQLFEIMSEKETNLCAAADVSSCDEVLKLANAVGPYICLLKMHIDILVDFTNDFIPKLQAIAQKHNFLIFEV